MRDAYCPDDLEILLIAESPPDPGSGQLRFFYSPQLTIDNLYRGVVEAMYGREAVWDKPAALRRLKADGLWLIDACDSPINHLPPSARRGALRAAVPDLVDLCHKLAPSRGVIICHAGVYAGVADALRAAGITVLHEESIPFPLGNFRAQFIAKFRAAAARDS